MRAVFRAEREQALISSYLPAKGFFVEVGAYEPVALSQTWQLEQRGWDGLLIEPLPEYAESLRRARRAHVFEVACGNPQQDGMTLPIYSAGALSSLRLRRGPPKMVSVATLDSLLARVNAPHVDFLSVDVEGTELDVLSGFSFERHRPKLILLEDFAEGPPSTGSCVRVAIGWRGGRATIAGTSRAKPYSPFHCSDDGSCCANTTCRFRSGGSSGSSRVRPCQNPFSTASGDKQPPRPADTVEGCICSQPSPLRAVLCFYSARALRRRAPRWHNPSPVRRKPSHSSLFVGSMRLQTRRSRAFRLLTKADLGRCESSARHLSRRRQPGRHRGRPPSSPSAGNHRRTSRPGALSSISMRAPCRRATAATRASPSPLPGLPRLRSSR